MSVIHLPATLGHGVGPLLFGMPEERARPIMAEWGEIADATAPGGALTLRTQGEDHSFSVYACFRPADGRLVTIEVWRPEVATAADVSIEGINIFGQPAEDVIQSLASRGFDVDQSEPFFQVISKGYVAFDREGGDDCDEDGISRFIESAFFAPSDYEQKDMKVALPAI